MNFGYLFTFQSLDKGLIERIGPTGFTASIFTSASNFNNYFAGILYQTAFIFLIFALLFFSFFVFGSFGVLSIFDVSFILLYISFVSLGIADQVLRK